MEPTTTTNTKSILGIFIFLGVAAGALALAMGAKKNSTPTITRDESVASTSVSIATTTIATSTATSSTAATKYKNGTYSATGTYKSPAGVERVNVSVVLENNIVTEVTFKGMAENAISIKRQEEFAGGYRALVIGKNIDSIALGKVSGSSLTSAGFNDALGKIKDEAEQL